ncbi:MAG: hypothetical protein MUP44_13680, partial [Anaerolineales bacterium]|nr:hypothetical protein [Anaerolineales bacterium]
MAFDISGVPGETLVSRPWQAAGTGVSPQPRIISTYYGRDPLWSADHRVMGTVTTTRSVCVATASQAFSQAQNNASNTGNTW